MYKRIISAIITLFFILPLGSGLTENTMPEDVQVFFDTFTSELNHMRGTETEYDILKAEGFEEYLEIMDFTLMTVAGGRNYYDSIYLMNICDGLALSVCCIGGKPAAYILDCTLLYVASGRDESYESLFAFTDAYNEIYPGDRDGFDGDWLLDLVYAESEEILGQVKQDYGDVLFSGFVYNGIGFDYANASLQLLPREAYEGLEMSIDEYHDLAFTCVQVATQEYLKMLY